MIAMLQRRSPVLLTAAAGLVALGACAGSIDTARTVAAPAARPTLPPVEVTPTEPDPLLVPPERLSSGVCRGVDPGPSYVRRLNRFEYNNTVRDLLGDQSHPADDFPAEEKKDGFEGNALALTVSPLLNEQYLIASERLAGEFVDRNEKAIPVSHHCDLTLAGGEHACALKFLLAFSRRAYRRPASTAEFQAIVRAYQAGTRSGRIGGAAAGSFAAGLKLAIMTMLQAPRFLYRIETGLPPRSGETVVRLDPWETASRLSYLIWGSMPDDELFEAAAQGRLATRADIATHAQRMLGNKKAHAVVARFNEQWLDLDLIDNAEKDSKLYPDFNRGIATLMREETDGFLDHVVWDADGTLPTLFSAPYTFIDSTLAKYYGFTNYPDFIKKDGKKGNRIQKYDLDGTTRAGLLTQGTFMAMLANANQTSPVRRGLFVRERLLCQELPPPPANAMIELPPLDPTLTTRERFTDHALEVGCSGCHNLMDPIGLGFENFDTLGRYRATENGKPVDASGEIEGMRDGKFSGVVELSRRLASSDEVRSCLTRRWFHFAYGREILAGTSDECSLDIVRRRFAAGGYKITDLLAALAETDAFLYRRVTEPR
jgi:hypothetical protein